MSEIVLDVKNLKKYFPVKSGLTQSVKGYVKAVDGISFRIGPVSYTHLDVYKRQAESHRS